MRRILAAAVAAAGTMLAAGAHAQSWPTKAVKLVSPFAAGGPTDTLARPVAEHLSKVLGQPVTIENRPGAGSTLGGQAVARAEPDGYTILFGTNSALAIGPALYTKAGYTGASFAPIILVAESPMILCVSNKSGVKSVAELIEAARKTPEAFSYASVGVATSTHLLGERLNQVAGLKMAHVPYRGSAPAMNDIIAGQVQVFFDVASSAFPNAQAGNLKIIMVLDTKRQPLLPDVPTSAEAGYADFIGTFWGGMAAPAGTPQPIVDRLNREVNDLLKTPEFVKLLANLTYRPVGGAPERLAEQMVRETKFWKDIGDRAGIRVD